TSTSTASSGIWPRRCSRPEPLSAWGRGCQLCLALSPHLLDPGAFPPIAARLPGTSADFQLRVAGRASDLTRYQPVSSRHRSAQKQQHAAEYLRKESRNLDWQVGSSRRKMTLVAADAFITCR